MADKEYGLNCGGDLTESELSQYDDGTVTRKFKSSGSSEGLDINTDYPASSGNFTKCSSRDIKYIVVHYVGTNGKARSVARYFQTSGRGASAHYVVGLASEDARIYRMVDDEDKAWHCGTSGTYYHDECRNSNSIGIETACHNDTSDVSASSPDWYFDDETVDALVTLVKYLMEKYGIDADHVVRHYDVTHKTCPAMWVHDAEAWAAFKARLTEDDTIETLVSSVAEKIGLSSPDYWGNVLNGETAANTAWVKAVFEKTCDAAGGAHTDETLIKVSSNLLGLSSPDYWQEVVNGKKTPPADYMTALFTKIDAAL